MERNKTPRQTRSAGLRHGPIQAGISEDSQADCLKMFPLTRDPILKLDFYNSLCASFTVEEIEAQLKNAGLSPPGGKGERKACGDQGVICLKKCFI